MLSYSTDDRARATTVDAAVAFDAAVQSSAGPRPDNQDSALAGERLVALADGVGGHVGGSVASALVISWLVPLARASTVTQLGATQLRQVIGGANARIAAVVDVRPWLSSMATTLVVVLADASGLTVAHTGDSRVYIQRNGQLSQVTGDQTFVQTLVDRGFITPAEAAVHPQRSVVYAALQGRQADLTQLQVQALPAAPGDRLLLCSDGLSDVVSADRLEQVLAENEAPARTARHLVQAALESGASDNVTVVVADVIAGRIPSESGPRTAGAAAHYAPEVDEALEALWPGITIATTADRGSAPT